MFSIIIPVYNVQDYLAECVDSVLKQTYQNYEIILVDDGSTDISGQICDYYAERDNRIHVVHKENGGAAIARNEGAKQAQGKYILYLDSDDFLLGDTLLQELKDKFEADGDEFILFKSVKYYDKNSFVDFYGDYKESVFSKSAAEIFRYMIAKNKQLACPWNRAVRRDYVVENDIYFIENTIAEDIPWTVKLFENAQKIGCINSLFHAYRQNRSDSVTNTASGKNLLDLFNIIRLLVEKYKQREDEFSKAVLHFMAFEYAILIYSLSRCDNSSDMDDLPEVFEYAWLLNYSIDKKSKAIKFLYKLFGIKRTLKIIKKLKR